MEKSVERQIGTFVESDALEEMIDPCQGTVVVGETCPVIQRLIRNKCENSLTPFSGENGASSMPAGSIQMEFQ